MTKRFLQLTQAFCVMMFLAGCAVTAPPVSTATDAEPATAKLEKCEVTDKCNDTLMEKYQHYLGVLSTIWIF